jgi:NTP pyrophosphatase (non-canonical NTP hydrolase)
MEFKEIERGVLKNAKWYSKRHSIKIDDDFAIMKLFEEAGELSEAYLTYKKKSRAEKYVSHAVAKKNLAKELADVVGIIMIIADILKIDLEDVIDKKWIHKDY